MISFIAFFPLSYNNQEDLQKKDVRMVKWQSKLVSLVTTF